MHASALLALVLLAPSATPPRRATTETSTSTQPEATAASGAVQCILLPTNGTPLLLGDVVFQTIMLTPTGSCEDLLDGSVHVVNSTDNQFKATSASIVRKGNTLSLILQSKIPAPEQGKSPSGTWSLFSSESAMSAGERPLAQLRITPTVATASVTTEVVFFSPESPKGADLSREHADRLTRIWKTQVNSRKTAYFPVSPSNTDLYNRATTSIQDLGPIDPNTPWKITSATATILETPSLAVIYFSPHGSSTEVSATATTARPSGETFTIALTLATSSQPITLPLPISEIGYTRCPASASIRRWDVIRHNQMAGTSNASITNGRCEVVISEEDINWSIAVEHGVPHRRYQCKRSDRTTSTTISEPRSAAPVNLSTDPDKTWEDGESRCARASALAGEEVTLFMNAQSRILINRLKEHYGQQQATIFVYTDPSKRAASAHKANFNASLSGHLRIPIDFGDDHPSADSPYHIDVEIQSMMTNEAASADLNQHPSQTYKSTLRPKGPFGYPHHRGSLGSRSVRVFATIPLDFTAIRFPAAGLDLQKTSDSTIAQISTLTTGLLLTAEPWDYARGTTMFVLPFRFQAGMLLSNWYKGVFHPSTFLGGSITLPLFRGTKQTDTDLALGAGWEVDLRSGYQDFGSRNHLLVTLGLNIFSLFGAQSAPK